MLPLKPPYWYFFLFVASTSVYADAPVELNCRIEPLLRIDVSSPVEGVLSEIHVKKNDTVKKGDALANLESSLQIATLVLRQWQSERTSDIDAQTLAYNYAERNFDRVSDLFRKKAASQSELDKARTEKELAAQQLQQSKDRKKQASLEYNRALADLNQRTITSPIDAIVVEKHKNPGEYIYLEPILQLVQIDPLKVEVYAPAHLYGRITEGMAAHVTPELKITQRSYNVMVDKVDKVVDSASGTFGITLLIPNPKQTLPSGLKCKVIFPQVIQKPLDLD